MSDTPPPTANVVYGPVSGTSVQSETVNGGITVHQSTYQPTGRPVVSLPYRAGTSPPRAVAFQPRAMTHQIVAALAQTDTVVLSSDQREHTSVVTGLGGVGKTQLALDYADQVWAARAVELLLWVTAGSRDGIVSSYARLAADLTGIEDTDPEAGAQRLREWLASTTARWLIVLDDVQDPADVRGLWPPATAGGRVVVTTRRHDAALRGDGRRVIEVDVFTPAEAIAYLETALVEQSSLRCGLSELAEALGCLPLALAQASAYMLDRGLSGVGYLARWNDRRRSLATLVPTPGELPDGHAATVAVTWSLSVEQANRLPPVGVAGPLLELASMLDPNGIPSAVFTTPAVLGLLGVDAEQVLDGLGCLRRLSLITVDQDSAARWVRVHLLVQRATRDALPVGRVPVVARAVADAVVAVWPRVERDIGLVRVLRANAMTLTRVAGEHLWGPDGHRVLFRVGRSWGEAGLVSVAVDYFDQLQATARKSLGPDHPDTLAARGNLARWRGESGDVAGAVTAFAELLTDDLRVLGPDHLNTLTTRNNLAFWRGRSGDAAGAAAAFAELLTDRIRVLGPDHPGTLTARSNLARWRGESGDAAGAAAAFAELLTDRIRVLGPDHPNTLATRSNLARWRGESGDVASAAAAFAELLTDCLRVLGPDHPSARATRDNLAYWQKRAST